jgi:hypothetical protein
MGTVLLKSHFAALFISRSFIKFAGSALGVERHTSSAVLTNKILRTPEHFSTHTLVALLLYDCHPSKDVLAVLFSREHPANGDRLALFIAHKVGGYFVRIVKFVPKALLINEHTLTYL